MKPAAPVTSTRMTRCSQAGRPYGATARSASLRRRVSVRQRDLAVVAQHEPQRPGGDGRGGYLDLLADQRVLDPADPADDGVLEHDRVLDLGGGDPAAVVDRGERADVRVRDLGPPPYDRRPADRRTGHHG